MQNMNLNEYKPKYGQDPALFNEMYMDYINRLNQDNTSDNSTPTTIHSDRPYSQQSSTIAEEDRNEQTIDESPGLPKQAQGNPGDLINISACEFKEFQQYMVGQYGEKQFKEGFTIIKNNRTVLYEDNGEQKLAEMLSGLNFASMEQMKGFINFCTTYLIVQNMQT